MSEILATTTLDSEFQEDEPRSDVIKRVYPQEDIPEWYRPTFDMVMANLDVIGPCKWMGNEKVRLGTAMWKLTRPTPENVHVFHANVVEFLADAAKETEEENPEPDEPEEVPGQADSDNQKQQIEFEEPAKAEKVETKKPTAIETQTEAANLPAETQPRTENQTTALVYAEIAAIATEAPPADASKTAAQPETAAASSDSPTGKSGTDNFRPIEVTPVRNIPSARPAKRTENNKTVQETRPSIIDKSQIKEASSVIESKNKLERSTETFEVPSPIIVAETHIEAVLKPVWTGPDVGHTNEVSMPKVLSEIPEPEFVTDSDLVDLDYEENPIDALLETAEAEFEPVVFRHEPSADDPVDLIEEEIILVEHLEGDNQEINEPGLFATTPWEGFEMSNAVEEMAIFPLKTEPVLPVQTETNKPDQLASIDLVVEEIEDSLATLAELIETSEPETVEAVDEILDEIIDIPDKFENSNNENIITDAEAQEELEELFTKLFTKMDVDYTPELIKSLTTLTLNWHLVDEIRQLKKEETDMMSHSDGTHEIIKKLLTGLSKIKRAIANAWIIGRSALQLYRFNFAI